MSTATLSRDYQVVIPQEVRETVGVQVGAEFEIIASKDRIELIPLSPREKLFGVFKGRTSAPERENDSVIRDDDGSLARLFRDYQDDGIREPLVDFGQAVGNEKW
jgi:AbrB family looped-hinge helix DNA binding protein